VLQARDGRARWRQLRRLCTVHEIRRALDRGRIVRVGRGLYVLPDLSAPRTAAASVGGVLSHLSAAREMGLAVLRTPDPIHVTVPRGSHRSSPAGVRLHHAPLRPDEIRRTLAVADSALRQGLLGRQDLLEAVAERRGPGRAKLRRVAEHASDEAASALESGLRAAVIDAGIEGFLPQLRIRLPGHRTVAVDLGDPSRKIALEADSYTHHGGRREFRMDCRRYNELVCAGWLVLRFPWEDVLSGAAGATVTRACALR